MTTSFSSESITTSESSATMSRKREIQSRIKGLFAELNALEWELVRLDLGLPEPYKLDDEIPAWMRKTDEARVGRADQDRRDGERGDDRRVVRDGLGIREGLA